jgi:hypothetical protein
MMPPPDDPDDLSDAEIAGIENFIESAPPTDATPNRTPALGALLSRGFDAVASTVARSAPAADMWSRILDALSDMSVRGDDAQQLQSLLNESGFTVSTALLPDPHDRTIIRHYTAATRADYTLALLQLPNWFMNDPNTFGNLNVAVEKIKHHHGRIVTPPEDKIAGGYTVALRSLTAADLSWEHVTWSLIKEAFEGKIQIEDALRIPVPPAPPRGRAPLAPAPKLRIDQGDIDDIVNIFTREWDLDKNFYAGLVQAGTDWPPAFRTQVNSNLKGNGNADASYVLNYLVTRNRYPPGHEYHTDTYLGRVLLRLLDSVGAEDSATFARIIVKYVLVSKSDDLESVHDKIPKGD